MGVTIHYAGQLRPASRLKEVVNRAEELAREMRWVFERIGSAPGSWPAGFVAYPHEDCEPLRLEFGSDVKVRGWVKTQFAGSEVHIQVVGFLRELKPAIGRFGVRDEGEYWETGSEETLRKHIDTINEVIKEMKDENPAIRIKVRELNGLIIDVIG